MPNPLDPLLESYEVARAAFAVVRLASESAATSAGGAALLGGSRFAGRSEAAVRIILSIAQRDLNDQTVLFLYAAFEAALRDDLASRAGLLASAAGSHAGFGVELAAWFAAACDDARMAGVTRLFAPAAGTSLNAVVGNVRKYRHWLAHGRRGTAPPAVSPQLAYSALGGFLRACGMT